MDGNLVSGVSKLEKCDKIKVGPVMYMFCYN